MASDSSPTPLVLDLSRPFGPTFIGTCLSSAMWGVSTLQVFIYYMHCDRDSRRMKALIGALWLLDSVNQALIIIGTWNIFVPQYGDPLHLGVVQLEQMHHTWVESIVIFIVQLYYIRRIYLYSKQTPKLAKSIWMMLLFILLFVLALWQLVGIVIYQIYGYGKALVVLTTALEVGLNMSLRIVAVAVDIIIAICMVILLTRSSTPHFKSTKRMVQRLILIAVSSGSITAVFVLLVLILLSRFPADLFYLTFEFCLCSLYFSTLLANLNSRDFIRGTDVVSGITDSSFRADGSTLPMGNLAKHSGNNSTLVIGGVKVDRSEDRTVDGPDVFNSSWKMSHTSSGA